MHNKVIGKYDSNLSQVVTASCYFRSIKMQLQNIITHRMQLFYDLIKITLRCFVPWSAGPAGRAVGAGVRAGTTILNCSLFQTAFPWLQDRLHFMAWHCMASSTMVVQGGWIPQDLCRPKLEPAMTLDTKHTGWIRGDCCQGTFFSSLLS